MVIYDTLGHRKPTRFQALEVRLYAKQGSSIWESNFQLVFWVGDKSILWFSKNFFNQTRMFFHCQPWNCNFFDLPWTRTYPLTQNRQKQNVCNLGKTFPVFRFWFAIFLPEKRNALLLKGRQKILRQPKNQAFFSIERETRKQLRCSPEANVEIKSCKAAKANLVWTSQHLEDTPQVSSCHRKAFCCVACQVKRIQKKLQFSRFVHFQMESVGKWNHPQPFDKGFLEKA